MHQAPKQNRPDHGEWVSLKTRKIRRFPRCQVHVPSKILASDPPRLKLLVLFGVWCFGCFALGAPECSLDQHPTKHPRGLSALKRPRGLSLCRVLSRGIEMAKTENRKPYLFFRTLFLGGLRYAAPLSLFSPFVCLTAFFWCLGVRGLLLGSRSPHRPYHRHRAPCGVLVSYFWAN